jgi:hypothetical protein
MDFFPLVGNLEFSLSDGGVKTLFLSGTLKSAGPSCSVGREASCYQQKNKAWSLGFI